MGKPDDHFHYGGPTPEGAPCARRERCDCLPLPPLFRLPSFSLPSLSPLTRFSDCGLAWGTPRTHAGPHDWNIPPQHYNAMHSWLVAAGFGSFASSQISLLYPTLVEVAGVNHLMVGGLFDRVGEAGWVRFFLLV